MDSEMFNDVRPRPPVKDVPSYDAEGDEVKLVDFSHNTYRKLVIFSLFLNLHFGVPALVFSILSQMDFEKGERKDAQKKGALAYKLAVAGICMTVFFLLIFLLLHIFVFPITLYPNIFNS